MTLPGPAASPLQQLRHIRRDFLGYLRDASRHGDLVRLRPAPLMSIVLVNHPALVREVLVSRAAEFRKTGMTKRLVGKFLGQGLVLAEGQEHQNQRRLLAPLFAPRRLSACSSAIYAQAAPFFVQRTGVAFDLQEAMTELALQGVLMVLFGRDATASADVGDAMRVFAESMAQRFRAVPWPEWIPTARNRSDRASIRALDIAIQELLERRQRRAPGDAQDVIGTLLEAQRTEQLPARSVRDQLATLYFAGHETTAKLLTWAALEVAAHPAIARELAQELASLPVNPTHEQLDALPLLDQVVCETLRLHPPAWVFDRMPATDVELGGVRLPVGTTLYLSPWVMHRDARWFDQPERFDPGRFAPGWETRIDRHAYFPFGVGARHCIGRALALLQAKAVLAALFRNFRIETNAPDPGSLAQPGATLGLSRAVQAVLHPTPGGWTRESGPLKMPSPHP